MGNLKAVLHASDEASDMTELFSDHNLNRPGQAFRRSFFSRNRSSD